MILSKPLINLNGNAIKDINAEIIEIYRSFNKSIELISKAEYSNGRNSSDQVHFSKMREEKAEIVKQLKVYKNSFIQLYKDINK